MSGSAAHIRRAWKARRQNTFAARDLTGVSDVAQSLEAALDQIEAEATG